MIKRNTKYVLIGIGGALLLGMAWLFVAHLQAKGVMEDVRKQHLAMGESWEMRSLVPVVEKTESNGARQMNDAAEFMARWPRGMFDDAMMYAGPGRAFVFSQLTNWPVELRDGKRRWVSNVWDEVPLLVDPQRMLMREMWDAATNDVIVIDLPYGASDPYSILLTHLGGIKNAYGMGKAAVTYDLHEGRFADALEHSLGAARMLAKYEREPFIISQLVRQVALAVLAHGVWESLQYSEWSDSQLSELQTVIASIRLAEPMVPAIRMEGAMGIKAWQRGIHDPGYLDSLGSGSLPTWFSTLGELLSGKGGLVDVKGMAQVTYWSISDGYYDGAFYLDQSRSNTVAFERLVVTRSCVAAGATDTSIPRGYIFSGMTLPAIVKACERTARSESLKSLMVMAIAIKRYELKHGRLPAESEELVPEFLSEIQIDWIDGKPIRYVPEADGQFRLWSIGVDATDGGGTSVNTQKNPLWDHDMIWPMPATLEDVARKRAELLGRMVK